MSVKLVLLVLCVGALGKFDVTLIARVPLGELLAIGSIPFLFRGLAVGRFRTRMSYTFGLMALWLLGVVVSDIVSGNHFSLFLRGAMKPIFTCLWTLFFIGILLRDFRLMMLIPLASIASSLQNYLMPQSYTKEYIDVGGYQSIAFGLVPLIVPFFSLFAVWMYRRNRWYAVVSWFMCGVTLGIVGAPRNITAISWIISAIIAYIAWSRGGHQRSIRLSLGKLCSISALGSLMLVGIYYLYLFLASRGLLGEVHYLKLMDQGGMTIFGNSPLGLILGGRPQIFGALLAILDKPLLGYGSWTAWQLTDYFYKAMEIVGSDPDILRQLSQGKVAGVGHSIVLVAWLENGIMSLFAMLGVGFVALKVLLKTIERDSRITPLIVTIVLMFAWAYFFSPFDTASRKLIGMIFALYIVDFPFMGKGSAPSSRIR